jgi:hypothetical protein
MIPFALLPYYYAKWIWVGINCLLMLILADYWWKEYSGSRQYRMASWLAALWFFPCIVAIYFGQMSIIVLAGVTGIAWSIRNRTTEWLCVFVFLASLKPHLLLPMWILLILWIARQGKQFTFVWAGIGVALAGVAVACLRPWIYSDYVLGAFSPHGPVVWATPTLGTALRVAFPGIQPGVAFLPSLCGVLLSLILWHGWRKSFAWDRALDPILLISLATASYAWIFDWAILLPVVLRVLAWFQSNPVRHWTALAGLVCVMSVFVWIQARGLFPLGAVWFPWGLALVYAWASWRQSQSTISGMMSRIQDFSSHG